MDKTINAIKEETPPSIKYVIIGGGLMGILTSYYLSENIQNKIVVLEKEEEVSEGASYANAGLLCPTLSYSIASPKLYRYFIYNILSGKIGMNQWFSKSFWKWFYYFTKCTLQNKKQESKKNLIHHKLCSYSLCCLQNIIDKEGLHDITPLRSGLITTYNSKLNFDFNKHNLEIYNNRTGYPYSVFTQKQTETLLKPFSIVDCIGSIHSNKDKIGDARNFALQLKEKCIERGVQFVHNAKVTGFKHSTKKVYRVHTEKGSFAADFFILCAGVYTPILSALLGVYVPIIPMKGYSITYHYKKLPKLPMYDIKTKTPYTIQDSKNSVGIIQFGQSIRIAGVADLFGYNYAIPKSRAEFLHSVFNSYFPNKTYTNYTEWTGLRPLTPDSLPIIGKLHPFTNVFVNAGHGMFGWTMCAGSSKILTDKIEGRLPKMFTIFFDLNRFNR